MDLVDELPVIEPMRPDWTWRLRGAGMSPRQSGTSDETHSPDTRPNCAENHHSSAPSGSHHGGAVQLWPAVVGGRSLPLGRAFSLTMAWTGCQCPRWP